MSKLQPNLATFLDRHQRLMAGILTRFRNIVVAATEPLPTQAVIPRASLTAMTIDNEVAALVKEIENLLTLNRELKQLWIAGPLRQLDDSETGRLEKRIDGVCDTVQQSYSQLIEMTNNSARTVSQLNAVLKQQLGPQNQNPGSSVAGAEGVVEGPSV